MNSKQASFKKRLMIVSICIITGVGAMAENIKSEKGWQMGTPIVSYWAGPMPMTDAVAKQMKDGGWNLVWVTHRGKDKSKKISDIEHYKTQLDILERHGLRGILSLGGVHRDPKKIDLDNPKKKAKLDAIIESVKNHPAMYAYSILDEPHAKLFENLARMKRYVLQKDPTHLVYINLLPVGSKNNQLGTTGPTNNRRVAYDKYVSSFVNMVQPQLLSYDHYTFADNGDGDLYFLNLAVMREQSLKSHIPFMAILQASSWMKIRRIPTGEELRWQAYTSLAYGSQGISWYVYGYPGHDGGMIYPAGTYRDPEIAKKLGSAVLGGEPTPLYYYVRELHKEFVHIALELQSLKSTGVYHTCMLPEGTVPLPDNCTFSIDPPVPEKDYPALRPCREGWPGKYSAEPIEGLVVGCFGKGKSPTHALVVNLDYRTYSGRGQARSKEFNNLLVREIVGAGPLEVFNAKAGKWSTAKGNRIKLRLPPGGGVLVRVSGK